MTVRMNDEDGRIALGGAGPHLGNRLLATLPPGDLDLLLPHAERVVLPLRKVLFEPGDDVSHAYFPAAGTVLSLVGTMSDGRAAELALVGCEGALGGLISAGDKPAFARAMVQVAGQALRLEAARLEEAKAASATLRDIIHRFTDALLAQVLQSVACSALHSVEERACRRLLEVHDRSLSDELPLTQEHFAELLGVQRTTVTRVVADLAAAGAIEARRGRIIVTRRARLSRGACECHAVVRRHCELVAPGLYPDPPGDDN